MTQYPAGLSRFGSERCDVSPGLAGMAVEQEQQDRNVRPRVGPGGDEDSALRGPSGPPVVYGPSISATQCETRGGDFRQGASELSRPASTMTTTERLLEKVAEGLHQLQQVQLDKMDKRSADEAPEQCKPGTTTLPPLPAPNGNESAVALQLSTQAGVGFHKRRTETKFEKSKSQKVEKFSTFRIFLHFSDFFGFSTFRVFWHFSDFLGFSTF